MAPGQIEMEALGQEVAHARFTRLYRERGRAVLAYALRRVDDPEDAADVVAETFMVAWRRLTEVPIGEAEILWLYGTARLVLANLHRSERRRTRLGARLAETLRDELIAPPTPSAEAVEALRAMRDLADDDRELLLLVAWEELSPGDAARVLGISALAARSRLHRARRRLRKLLDDGAGARSAGPKPETEDAR
jgi:RNA polymerase sigma-70 factor, ECF subfamily